MWVPNYGSTQDHRDFAKDKFEEEVREGMMEKMSMEAFVDRYGENRAIAALAVIVEDEDKGKKRLIHDAAHGVRVNHRIRCRDKITREETDTAGDDGERRSCFLDSGRYIQGPPEIQA